MQQRIQKELHSHHICKVTTEAKLNIVDLLEVFSHTLAVVLYHYVFLYVHNILLHLSEFWSLHCSSHNFSKEYLMNSAAMDTA
jgi:adenosyl cobinamide kinase/adenosyl cobinamide phosphate guanylyltransferase